MNSKSKTITRALIGAKIVQLTIKSIQIWRLVKWMMTAFLEIANRGVNTAVCVMLESSDRCVLLTRRGKVSICCCGVWSNDPLRAVQKLPRFLFHLSLLFDLPRALQFRTYFQHMRTFPNVWVPPGGGLEYGETLQETGIRELGVSHHISWDYRRIRKFNVCKRLFRFYFSETRKHRNKQTTSMWDFRSIGN